MALKPTVAEAGVALTAPAFSLEARLERGGVEYFPVCPFTLPEGEDHLFLLEQRLASRAHKNISYDPNTGRAAGFARISASQSERLRIVLATFAQQATSWLARTLPRYARTWRLDRVSFRPEEEATRRLRLKARNDLIHVDAFPSRPTNGHRILRLFVNINPSEPRIWATSEPFGKLLERFGRAAGFPTTPRAGWTRHVLRLFRPGRMRRSPYDAFMLRFHDFLKANDEFQEHGPKRFWTFAPGSAWLAFTDVASHAVLRGRYALEHSYFVTPETLALPDESPPALLERACGMTVLNRAA
ncbi:MAG TPA: Kdo hydroxylase family protein [Gemmataceae bacterium]|nr:Kdo hydroxylase family protein [Gemmataceae bacterium]